MYRVLMPGEPEVRLEVSKAVLASRPGQGQDRVAIVRVRGGYVVAVADGAGGLGGGAKAADRALRDVAAHARTDLVQEPQAWTSLLEGTDAALASAGGQCAIVLASVIGTRIVGASVGDCGAWLVDDTTTDLTAKQFRKPLLGSGASSAVPFEAELNPGATLLLASDGLLKHAPHERISSLMRDTASRAAIGWPPIVPLTARGESLPPQAKQTSQAERTLFRTVPPFRTAVAATRY